jgi:hypothetical protein
MSMDSTLEILDLLARRYAFGEIAALVDAGVCAGHLSDRRVADVQQLCAFGARLVDLDAEDFGEADAAADANVTNTVADRVQGDHVPPDLVARSARARMPRASAEVARGALDTLAPAYALLLEVVAVRWHRKETAWLVATLHIASEYLPLLAWEPVLGHAADPARMPASVGGEHSRWGDPEDRQCPHTRPEKSACDRVLRVAGEPPSGWRAYFTRQHSIVAEAFGVCATDCRTPCSVVTRHPPDVVESLARRCGLATEFANSSVIRLRHAAPVGHGFGVPSPGEVLDTWAHTRTVLGARDPAILTDDGFPLPGLPSLFGAIAGRPIGPDTLIEDTVDALRRTLR